MENTENSPLGQDIAAAWKLLEKETGDTSADLAHLHSHFDWVSRKWALEPGQKDLLVCLNAAIGRELKQRGYNLGVARTKGKLEVRARIARPKAKK